MRITLGTALKCEVAYFEGNLIFTRDRRVLAAYVIDAVSYSFLNREAKEQSMRQFASMLHEFKGAHQFISVCRQVDAVEFYKKIQENTLKGALNDDWLVYCEYMAENLDNSGSLNREFFVILELQAARSLGLDDVKSGLKDGYTNMLSVFQSQPIEVDEDEFAELEKAQFRQLSGLNDIFGGRIQSATTGQIQYLLSHPFWRSLPQEDYESPLALGTFDDGKALETEGVGQYFRPKEADLIQLTEGVVEANFTNVKVYQGDTPDDISYQTFVVIGNMPTDIYFPGYEYLFWIEQLDFPVDIAVSYVRVENEAAGREIKRKRATIKDQAQHTAQATDEMPTAVKEGVQTADKAQEYLETSKAPLLKAQITLAISAKTPQELSVRRDVVMRMYRQKLAVYVPRGDQLRLFEQFLPGAKRMISAYTIPMTCEALAAMMPHATQSLGDPIGPILGYSIQGAWRPVFFDPALPPKINKSPCMSITGTLGKGKTMTVLKILTESLLRGSRALVIDPKAEYDKLLNIPAFKDKVSIVELSAGSKKVLNPFALTTDPALQRSIVTNFLCDLVGAEINSPEFRLLTHAVKRVVEGVTKSPTGVQSPSTVIQAVREMALESAAEGGVLASEQAAAAQNLVNVLEAYSELPLAHVAFGSGDAALSGESLRKNRVTVIVIRGLSLPEKEQLMNTSVMKLTIDQRLSMSLMYLAASAAKIVAEQSADVNKIICVDEAWALISNSAGQLLAKQIDRMGRSLNVGLWLITQDALDIMRARLHTHLSNRLAFGCEDTDESEIEAALTLVGLPFTPETRGMINSLKTGQCLMRDAYGRIGVVQITHVNEGLKKAFSSTPGSLSDDEDASAPDQVAASTDNQVAALTDTSNTDLNETDEDINDGLDDLIEATDGGYQDLNTDVQETQIQEQQPEQRELSVEELATLPEEELAAYFGITVDELRSEFAKLDEPQEAQQMDVTSTEEGATSPLSEEQLTINNLPSTINSGALSYVIPDSGKQSAPLSPTPQVPTTINRFVTAPLGAPVDQVNNGTHENGIRSLPTSAADPMHLSLNGHASGQNMQIASGPLANEVNIPAPVKPASEPTEA